MSIENEDRACSQLRRFYRACKRRQTLASNLLAQGRAARVLAASKPGGLLLNVEAPELTFFIADGMDITSQLVSVVTDTGVHAALKESLRDDIRISVHLQRPVEFLGDIRDHRFDLISFGRLDPPAAGRAVASLAPGGLLAVFPDAADGGDNDALERALDDCGMVISPATGGALIAARAPEHLKAKRRGGRRNRPPLRG